MGPALRYKPDVNVAKRKVNEYKYFRQVFYGNDLETASQLVQYYSDPWVC